MRHGKKVNHLGRTASHRKAMLSNMAGSLIEHKRIYTTLAKAKVLRQYIEPLITKSKKDDTHSRRSVFSYLQNKLAVSKLFGEVSQKTGERHGGYTRIIKTGFRAGDSANMAMIELVDFNEIYSLDKSKKKATRRRRPSNKSIDTVELVS
ncbi:MAG: 50S ribosomal protein L17 [Flavobacteriales bacterium Tduv]